MLSSPFIIIIMRLKCWSTIMSITHSVLFSFFFSPSFVSWYFFFSAGVFPTQYCCVLAISNTQANDGQSRRAAERMNNEWLNIACKINRMKIINERTIGLLSNWCATKCTSVQLHSSAHSVSTHHQSLQNDFRYKSAAFNLFYLPY